MGHAELQRDEDRAAQRGEADDVAAPGQERHGDREDDGAQLHRVLCRRPAVHPPDRERRPARGLEAQRAVEEGREAAEGQDRDDARDRHDEQPERDTDALPAAVGREQRREGHGGELREARERHERPAAHG
jgi:hypothetical protein